MQKAFEKLRYHKRKDDGYSIWTCAVEGPKSTKKYTVISLMTR